MRIGYKWVLMGVLAGVSVSAQDKQTKPADPVPNEVKVNDSPAAQLLNQTAVDHKKDSTALNDAFQQARTMLDKKTKDLKDQIDAQNKQLHDLIIQDKKLKPYMDKIDDLSKQLQTVAQTASAEYQNTTATLQGKVATENAQIEAYKKIVKRENNMPDDATYDEDNQKWNVPVKK